MNKAMRAAAALMGRRGGSAGGRKGGLSRSPAKVAAARLNAAKATAARVALKAAVDAKRHVI